MKKKCIEMQKKYIEMHELVSLFSIIDSCAKIHLEPLPSD